jgi:23S rRNA (cytidine1920-2'-O)/16S rRNA (cytidine1409-2'-O)-methyltransferase
MDFVSRAGQELHHAMVTFKLSPAEWVCADLGANVGGFTDCVLQLGAKKVYAIDTAYGVLDWKLRNDPRVVVREGVNARYITAEDVPVKFDLAVCDASFISTTLLIPAIVPLLTKRGEMVILVKPQFEAGKGEVGKGGIVRDPAQHRQACDRVQACVEALGFRASIIESPIKGAEGNREFLLYAQPKT